MNITALIDKYYKDNDELRTILIRHSEDVANRALQIADRHPELKLNRDFLYEAGMLHDIGIIRTDAKGIKCFGTEPYIRHGVIGAEMLRNEGLPRHARVCERHTGAGITLKQIKEQHLPLPEQDFLPETMEEKVICYADKFYSKSHLERVRTVEQAVKSLSKYGQDGVSRFMEWFNLFEKHYG